MLDGNVAEQTPIKEEEKTMRVYRSTNLSKVFLSIAFVAICMFGISAANVQAATFTVVNTNDDGAGSLRQAIADANAAAGADTIDFDTAGVFAAPQTITLTSENLFLTDVLTIIGTGADRLAIVRDTSGTKFRIFTVISPATVFNGLTVSGGDDLQGSGIYNSGTLTLNNCRVASNRVSDPSLESEGAGIYNRGTLTINSSTISRNKSFAAAGVHNTGTLTVNNSTFFNNDATFGGAVFSDQTLTIKQQHYFGQSCE
jgi:predicted outer membrane repeat protein